MKWVELNSVGGDAPQPRSSHSLTSINGGAQLVMWGGEHAPRVPVDTDVWLYDMAARAWARPTVSGDAPSARLGHVAAAIGSTVYIHGGRTEVAESTALSDLFAYDAAAARWARVAAAGPQPSSRNYHAACAAGDCIYVFGGCGDAGRMSDLWRFDPAVGTWQELPRSAAIKGRGGAGLVAAAGGLWVLGGFTGAEAADCHRYDLRAGRWEEVPSGGSGGGGAAPTPALFTARSVFARGAHACSGACDHLGHVVVFGGEIDPSDKGHAGAGRFSGDVLCLDTADMSWHVLEVEGQGPGPRGWGASAEVPAGLVVSGGIEGSNSRLGDLFFLDMHA